MRFVIALVALVGAGCLAATAGASPAPTPAVSSNWAGYAIAAQADAAPIVFSDVTGTWTEPRATCAAGATTASAFWVGLGGAETISTPAGLEQLGTSADCTNGTASYSAWFEILPDASTPIRLKIAPGDSVTAAVVVVGRRVIMSLKNVTRKTRFTRTVTTDQTLDDTTAEWVAEAPSVCSSAGGCRVLPLTNFGAIGFSSAAAIGNGHPGTISDPTWQSEAIQLSADATVGGFRAFGAPALTSLYGAAPSTLTADGRGFSVAVQASTG
jgi:hypothetical protein